MLGAWLAVRCPREFDHLMRRAGGLWDPGSKRWLIEQRRIGPLVVSSDATPIPCSDALGWSWT
jgi:hypothetical protein